MLKLAVCLQGESQVKSNLQRGLSSNRQQQTLHLASTAIRVRRIAPSFVMELHDALRDENVMKSLSNTEYDAIILGTGIVESILSTSLALNGKKVLHLDKVRGDEITRVHFNQCLESILRIRIWSNSRLFCSPRLDIILSCKCQHVKYFNTRG